MRIGLGFARLAAGVLGVVFLVPLDAAGGQSVPSANRLTVAALPANHPWPAGKARPTSPTPIVEGGVIILSVRGVDSPQDVTVWSRSGHLSFFEVAPLVGVLANTSPVELDDILKKQSVENASSDSDRRRELISRTLAAERLSDTKTALERYDAERRLLDDLHDHSRTTQMVSQLWPDSSPSAIAPAGTSASGSPRNVWRAVAQAVSTRRLRRPLIRVTVLPGSEPRVLGYLLEFPPTVEGSIQADALVALDDAEPERLQVVATLPSAPLGAAWWRRVVTSFADMLGVISGAVIGFGVFVLQQWYSKRTEAQREFDRKKVELSKKIRQFFAAGGNYEALRDATYGTEPERVRNVRDALVDEGIYAIFPARVALRINELARTGRTEHDLVPKMDTLLTREFAEFMDGPSSEVSDGRTKP